MAYVQKSQMQEEEQQGPQAPGAPTAPTIAGPSLGSTASLGGSAGNVGTGGLGAQGAQAQGAGAGTGFTNIDRVLGANKNAGADLKKSADETQAKEQRNFDVGVSAAQMAVNAGGTGLTGDGRTDLVKGLQTDTSQYRDVEKETPIEGGVLKYTERMQTQGDDRTKAIDLAKAALNQTYTGPTEFKYDVGGTKEAQQLRAMGNAQSAGVALADKAGPLANYNTGLSAIDQAIYGANAGKELGQIADASKAQTESQLTQQKSVADRAKAAQDSILSGQGDLRRELENLGGRLSSVDSARGVNTNQGSLQAIGKVLGDTSLGATPNAPRPGPALAQQPVQQQQAQAPTPQFSGEDRKAYENLVRLGYAPAQAAQRIQAQIGSNVGDKGDTGASIAEMRKRGMSNDQIKATLGITDEIMKQYGG